MLLILHMHQENGLAQLTNPPHPTAGGGDSPDASLNCGVCLLDM
ncbi:MAG: hypothetical protein PVF83_19250 [Anaerolineales bacterium]